jgi:hypothetical protein
MAALKASISSGFKSTLSAPHFKKCSTSVNRPGMEWNGGKGSEVEYSNTIGGTKGHEGAE